MTFDATHSIHLAPHDFFSPTPCADHTHDRSKACVTIAHTSLLVAAGLASMLGALHEFDVRLWTQTGGTPPVRAPRASVHIIIGDADTLRRICSSDEFGKEAAHSDAARCVLMTLSEHLTPVETLGKLSISACLSVDCQPQLLIATIRRLSRRFDMSGAEAPEAQPRSVVRGGLAPGALRRVREHIQTRLGDRIQLSDLAAIAELSDCHFSRAFKQSMGMPPHQYVMQQRIETAALLIERTDRPLAEIALEVGFSDQSHFTRMFSRLARQTPRDYRHRCR